MENNIFGVDPANIISSKKYMPIYIYIYGKLKLFCSPGETNLTTARQFCANAVKSVLLLAESPGWLGWTLGTLFQRN